MQISASGMGAAQTMFDGAAHNIANVSTEDVVATAATNPDLATDMGALVLAEALYGANAKMLQSLVETQRAMIDVRA